MGNRRKNKPITPALPIAARQLVASVKSAENSGNWSPVHAVLADHPELYDIMQGIKARGESAQAQGKSASANNTPFYASSRDMAIKQSPTTLDMQVINDRNQPDMVNNVRVLRRYSMINPWIRALIDKIRVKVAGADIAVMPLDPTKKYDKAIQAQLMHIIKHPNEQRQNWGEFIGSVLEDILVLDRGCITKDMTPKRRPLHLYAEDGGNVRIYPQWDGNPKTPRYLWDPPEGAKKMPLRNDEAIVICRNPATYRFGLSPVQTLIDTIQRDLDASMAVSDGVTQKPPAQIVHLQGATDSAVRAVRATYDSEIAGKKKVMFAGGEGEIKMLPFIYKDGEWLPWLTYLVQLMAAVFQLSPQSVGFLLNANKSNSQTQADREIDDSLVPLMLTLELYLNEEFVGDYAPKDMFGAPDLEKLNLGLVFPKISEQARYLHAADTADLAKTVLGGLPSMTINEVRLLRGDEPYPGGDSLYIMTKTGAMLWLDENGYHEPESATVTSGNVGAQGPSGPEENDDVDGMSDNASGSGGEGAAPNLDGGLEQGTSNVQGSGSATGKAWYDARTPGKAWRPEHMRKVTLVPVTKAKGKASGRDSVTSDARRKLEAKARAIFNEVGKAS